MGGHRAVERGRWARASRRGSPGGRVGVWAPSWGTGSLAASLNRRRGARPFPQGPAWVAWGLGSQPLLPPPDRLVGGRRLLARISGLRPHSGSGCKTRRRTGVAGGRMGTLATAGAGLGAGREGTGEGQEGPGEAIRPKPRCPGSLAGCSLPCRHPGPMR